MQSAKLRVCDAKYKKYLFTVVFFRVNITLYKHRFRGFIMEIFSTVIEVIGVIAFSVSGSMVAIRRKTDLFGVMLLAILTSMGGGLLRDTIFSFSPPAIFGLKWYLLICVVVSIIVFLIARKYSKTYLENETKIEHINDVFDALGLGIFAIVGTKVGIENGFGNDVVITLSCGVISGIGGGIIRDVLTKSIPFVLVKRIYAIAAILGSGVYYIMYLFEINDEFAIVTGVLVTFILRLLAMIFKWNMPKAIE